jgi:hypothetical protein
MDAGTVYVATLYAVNEKLQSMHFGARAPAPVRLSLWPGKSLLFENCQIVVPMQFRQALTGLDREGGNAL